MAAERACVERAREVAEGMGSRVELFERIRRDRELEGMSTACVGREVRGAQADGPPGVGVGGAAGAQAAGGSAGAERWVSIGR